VFRHESRDLLQENCGRGITGSVVAAGAQMSGVPGLVSFSGDGHRDSFCHGQIPTDTTDCGLRGGARAVCLAAVEGLEAVGAAGREDRLWKGCAVNAIFIKSKGHIMEKFLLLIREDAEQREKMTQEEFDQCIQIMSGWVESLAQAGNFISCEPLEHRGRMVGKDNVVSDGPFIEAKEAISGYFLIHAENLEQAASIAQTNPFVLAGRMSMEVRPVILFGNE
jgi:hypothetical protein